MTNSERGRPSRAGLGRAFFFAARLDLAWAFAAILLGW
jgi:hypothetical protein